MDKLFFFIFLSISFCYHTESVETFFDISLPEFTINCIQQWFAQKIDSREVLIIGEKDSEEEPIDEFFLELAENSLDCSIRIISWDNFVLVGDEKFTDKQKFKFPVIFLDFLDH
jgi:hypothetical protein